MTAHNQFIRDYIEDLAADLSPKQMLSIANEFLAIMEAMEEYEYCAELKKHIDKLEGLES